MNKIILMVGHQSKVGKDTLADELVLKAGFIKIAFADKLKEICSDLFFIPLHEFYDEKLKNEIVERYGITRRQILQKVGQAMFSVDKYVWVNHAIEKFGNSEKIVITDFRFPHEIKRIQECTKDFNYKVMSIKIHREGISNFTGSDDSSEISLIAYPWDFHIQNDGTIDDLYCKAMNMLS